MRLPLVLAVRWPLVSLERRAGPVFLADPGGPRARLLPEDMAAPADLLPRLHPSVLLAQSLLQARLVRLRPPAQLHPRGPSVPRGQCCPLVRLVRPVQSTDLPNYRCHR